MASLPDLSPSLHKLLQERGLTVATAESCTTGRIAATLGQVAGASSYLRGGIVAYATELKTQLLGVPAELILAHHVVSEAVASAMARGAMERLGANIGIASTGLAGPGGAEEGHPVGMVCLAVTWREEGLVHSQAKTYHFEGDRESIILQATTEALRMTEAVLLRHDK